MIAHIAGSGLFGGGRHAMGDDFTMSWICQPESNPGGTHQ